MENLNKVITGLECCMEEDRSCRECPYECGRAGCLDDLMGDVLEVLRKLDNDLVVQDGVILDLNRDLERARLALNAQGEYAFLGGNLISREALIEKVESLDWHSTNDKGVLHSGAADEESAYVRYVDVVEVIEKALAVEAEPVVHAHWIMRGGRFRCSRCDARALWQDTGGTHGYSHEYEQVKTLHCPNPKCGAVMDEEVSDGT